MDNDAQYKRLVRIGTDLLVAIGEDPARPGLRETPERFARHWQEFLSYDAGKTDTTFESAALDQMVVVSGIKVWSLCEHHLLPFSCEVAVGYITQEQVIGLSKIPRFCHMHAHKLQLQEQLVDQIADEIVTVTGSDNVAVVGTGVHTCMTMRGIKSDGTMSSSVMRGRFKENHHTRLEFLSLAGIG